MIINKKSDVGGNSHEENQSMFYTGMHDYCIVISDFGCFAKES